MRKADENLFATPFLPKAVALNAPMPAPPAPVPAPANDMPAPAPAPTNDMPPSVPAPANDTKTPVKRPRTPVKQEAPLLDSQSSIPDYLQQNLWQSSPDLCPFPLSPSQSTPTATTAPVTPPPSPAAESTHKYEHSSALRASPFCLTRDYHRDYAAVLTSIRDLKRMTRNLQNGLDITSHLADIDDADILPVLRELKLLLDRLFANINTA